MERFERREAVSRNKAELPGLPIDAPEVQGALALAAYRAAHGRQDIDTVDWERNDPATQSSALYEWIGKLNDKNSSASLYRAYAEKHPHKRIDIGDEEALKETLNAILAAKEREQ